ncbi:hypothetical protein BG004_004728 [Podila humilis]|nr:hypothetical protein BG004_004728 [Podila humilis]
MTASHPHRSSLRAPAANVRWPVNLNQLAAMSLDDDSDLDRSFTDVSSQDIGSVKLLRMLKDSDDETTAAVTQPPTRLRRYALGTIAAIPLQTNNQKTSFIVFLVLRALTCQAHWRPPHRILVLGPKGENWLVPRSVYSGLQRPSSKSSSSSVDLARSSSQRKVDVNDSSISKSLQQQQHRISSGDLKGLSASSSSSSLVAQNGTPRRTVAVAAATTSYNVSAISALSKLSRPIAGPGGTKVSSATLSSTHSTGSMIQHPKALARSISGSSLAPRPKTSLPTLSSSSLVSKPSASNTGSTALRRRSVQSPASASSGPSTFDQEVRGTSSPARLSRGSTPTTLSKSGTGQQYSFQTHEATDATTGSNQTVQRQVEHQKQPLETESATAGQRSATEEMAAAMISELTEELERWKTEVREYRQERVLIDTRQKQILDLERDLKVALESLQAAEGKTTEAMTEKDQAIRNQKVQHQEIVSKLQAEMEHGKLEREKLSQELSKSLEIRTTQKALESINQEHKLAQAQQEIEQLEMQTVPAELQDVHQAHFQAIQELEQVKIENQKLKQDLSKEKLKVTQEQEESGNLLVKLSQLQETIANQLRDNNLLKDHLKEHEKSQESEVIAENKHKQVLELKQKAFQDKQLLSHQLQQQLQLQQTQLLQQQTEIVNLRAAFEVEQKQAAMLLQQQTATAAVAIAGSHFGRRVSLDGELNESFLVVESSGGFNGNALLEGSSSSAMMSSSSYSSGAQSAYGANVANASANGSSFSMNTSSLPPPSLAMPGAQYTMGGMTSSSTIPLPAAMHQTTGHEAVEIKPRMIHRGSSSGSVSGIGANTGSRISIHGDAFGSSAPSQSVEELATQLNQLMKEKEKLQADLSKIPLTGGGPMARRKVEMLEESMDETERAMSKIRYSLRLRS